jgi:pimeloyl-ACP methyl ester carboxylesterase
LADLKHGALDAAGVTLRYVEQGEGAPVVLVHSYGGDLRSQWLDTGVFQALAREFRVIAFDCRGHGASDRPHDAAAYGVEMTWDIARIVDRLARGRAHVVGYSMGAHLVAQLLALAPDRCLSATLGGGTGRRHWTEADERQAATEADEMARGSLASQMRRLWPPGKAHPSEKLIERSSALFLSGKDRDALAAVRRSAAGQVFRTEALRAVGVPLLGIVGSEDPYLASYDELRTVLPQMELVVIEGADHAGTVARREFAESVSGFLRRVERGGV